ncbi:MAG: hypothetical protein AB7S26_38965 [Sandaracinaceae bacterium]
MRRVDRSSWTTSLRVAHAIAAHAIAAVVIAALVIAASPAAAQIDLSQPDPIAVELAEVRASQLDQRRAFGVALLVPGLGSAVAGGVALGFGIDDPLVLGASIGLLSWGLVNAVASLFLMDLGDARRAAIERDRAVRYDELSRARDDALRQQDANSATWAFNAGLDVFYVATGILLYFLADQLDSPADAQALRGYAAVQTAQGGYLLFYDLIGWICSAENAGRVARIPQP